MLDILKLLHVIFVFSWIGTLLVLTRFLVYQVQEEPQNQTLLSKISYRMYFLVDLPSMILAVSVGIVLLTLKEVDWRAAWLHMKLTFAFFLILCDLTCGWRISRLHRRPVQSSGRGYKLLHGAAGLFLILVLVSIYILKNNLN